MNVRPVFCFFLVVLGCPFCWSEWKDPHEGWSQLCNPYEGIQPAEVYVERLKELLDGTKTLSADMVLKIGGEHDFGGEKTSIAIEAECSVCLKDGKLVMRRYEHVGDKVRTAEMVDGNKVHRLREGTEHQVQISPRRANYMPKAMDWLLPHRRFLSNLPEDLSEVCVEEVAGEDGDKFLELSYGEQMLRLDARGWLVGWRFVLPVTEEALSVFGVNVRFEGKLPAAQEGMQYRETGQVASYSCRDEECVGRLPHKLKVLEETEWSGKKGKRSIEIKANRLQVNTPVSDDEVRLELREGMRVYERTRSGTTVYYVNKKGQIEKPWFWERLGDWVVRAWN